MTQPNPTVSGPGKFSQRTDRQPIAALTDAAYGEQQTFRDLQQGAPMAKAATPDGSAPVSPVDLSQVVPMGAPTQRPNEPVTAGAAAGPGAGVEALGLPSDDSDPAWQDLVANLPALELMANQPTAGAALRQFVRRVRAMA